MTQDLDSLLQLARNACLAGGDVLMRFWRDGVAMRSKESIGGASYDLVSDADLESEQAIAAQLYKGTPDFELLGEETLKGSVDAQHLWVIDPLDGTNNYAHHLPHFAISIAYYYQGHPRVGVIYNPAREDWFTAVSEGGAYHNGRRVKVSDATYLDQALIGCGFYYDRGEMMKRTLAAIEQLFEARIHGIRRFGTASLDLCQVGCGQFGGFFEYQLAPWDFAAGRLFVEEAGGLVTDAQGAELKLSTTSVLAASQQLHSAILEITKRHHP